MKKEHAAGTATARVAHSCFQTSLKPIFRLARAAAEKSSDRIERVHRLRVATCRARAALQLFGHLLPKRKRKWLKASLRAIHIAACEARDLDVLSERLASRDDLSQVSAFPAVFARIADERRHAQKILVLSSRKIRRGRFKQRSRSLSKHLRRPSKSCDRSMETLAQTTLVTLLASFIDAAKMDHQSARNLHRMRIAGKKVRYAGELLGGFLSDAFRNDLHATFTEIQEKLGVINDHASAISRCNAWLKQSPEDQLHAELQCLVVQEEQQFKAACQAFSKLWSESMCDRIEDLNTRLLLASVTVNTH